MADIVPGPVAGIDCKLYYNSATTRATPTWVEVTKARDVAVPDYGVNAIEANSRASLYECFVAGLIKVSLTFTYLHYRGADTVRDYFTTMVSSRTVEEFAAMDGTITLVGARGVKFYGIMEKFAYTQDLEGAQVWDASVKPAYEVQTTQMEPTLLVVT